ncbi:MAG: ferritin-like domain-containing protein [Solirubrobacteraceae bacterium]
MSEDAGASRRALLGRAGAALASVGALTLAGCGSAAAPQPMPPADVAQRDLALLTEPLALERRTVAAYVAGIPLLSHPQRITARQFLNEDLEHVGELLSLMRSLGGHPGLRPNSFQLGRPQDAAEVLELWHELESALVGMYLRTIPQLSPGPLRAAVASILTVDAQHVSLLRLQQGRVPVPSALVTAAE